MAGGHRRSHRGSGADSADRNHPARSRASGIAASRRKGCGNADQMVRTVGVAHGAAGRGAVEQSCASERHGGEEGSDSWDQRVSVTP